MCVSVCPKISNKITLLHLCICVVRGFDVNASVNVNVSVSVSERWCDHNNNNMCLYRGLYTSVSLNVGLSTMEK